MFRMLARVVCLFLSIDFPNSFGYCFYYACRFSHSPSFSLKNVARSLFLLMLLLWLFLLIMGLLIFAFSVILFWQG